MSNDFHSTSRLQLSTCDLRHQLAYPTLSQPPRPRPQRPLKLAQPGARPLGGQLAAVAPARPQRCRAIHTKGRNPRHVIIARNCGPTHAQIEDMPRTERAIGTQIDCSGSSAGSPKPRAWRAVTVLVLLVLFVCIHARQLFGLGSYLEERVGDIIIVKLVGKRLLSRRHVVTPLVSAVTPLVSLARSLSL